MKSHHKIVFYALAILTGFLAFIPVMFPSWWIFGMLATLPLIVSLKKAPPDQLTRLSFVAGFFIAGISISWVFGTLSYDWLGTEEFLPVALGGILFWFIASCSGGLAIVLLTLLWEKIKTDTNIDILLFSFLWSIFEFVRAWLVSIVFFNNNAAIGPHWTLGALGYTLSQNIFFPVWSSWGGLYWLSFITVAFSFSVYQLITLRHRSKKILLVIIWILFFAFSSLGLLSTPQPTSPSKTEIIVLGTDSETPPVWSEEILANETRADLTIVIFPEDYRFLKSKLQPETTDSEMFSALANFFQRANLLVVDSAKINEDGKNKMKMIYVDTQSSKILMTEKVLLAPFGEYLPLWLTKPAQVLGLKKWLANFQEERAIVAGEVFQPVKFGNEKVSILFCGEVFSPTLYRKQVKNGATLIGNSSSQLFIGRSKILSQQIKAAAKMRAAENRRHLALASASGPAFIINPQGQIITENQNRQPFIRGTVPTEKSHSPYTKGGDWFLFLALFFCLLSSWGSGTFTDKISQISRS